MNPLSLLHQTPLIMTLIMNPREVLDLKVCKSFQLERNVKRVKERYQLSVIAN